MKLTSILGLLLISFLIFSSIVISKDFVLFDESVESPAGVSTGNWIVNKMAGNTWAGQVFYQGAAREVGGISAVKVVETPEGIYVVSSQFAKENPYLLLIQDGMLRLLMETEGDMEGPIEMCQGGYPTWSESDQTLYLTGPSCLRKIVVESNGSRRVEIVAGRCGISGSVDGPALTRAKLQRSKGIAAMSDGTIYWLENEALRKIKNGRVTTVSLKFVENNPLYAAETSKPFWQTRRLKDDHLSAGDDDNTLYINDYYDTIFGYGVLKVDLTPGVMTIEKIAGTTAAVANNAWAGTKYVDGKVNDGTPREQLRLSGGGAGRYNKFYNALLLDGNDNTRYRWLKIGADKVTTIFGTPIDPEASPRYGIDLANSARIPGERFFRGPIAVFIGAGRGEGIYVMDAGVSGFFRAYDSTKTDGVLNIPDTSVASNRDGRIRATILKTDGTELSASFKISPLVKGVQTQPKVAYSKGVYLVVWAELSGDDFNVLGARVSSDGTLLDSSPIEIDTRLRTQTMPDVASDDNGFMVVWGGFEDANLFTNVYAQRINFDGNLIGTRTIIDKGASPEIAWNEFEEKFLIIYVSSRNNMSNNNKWIILNPDSTKVPAAARYPYFYAKPRQEFSVSALPASGQGWTFLMDHDYTDRHGKSYGMYRAITILPNGTYDPEHFKDENIPATNNLPMNPPWYARPWSHNPAPTPSWWLDYERDTPDQWPKGPSAIAVDKDYAIAVWGRYHREGLNNRELYNSDLYIGRLDKFNLVESTGMVLSNSSNSERHPSIAGDKNGNLIAVYEKIMNRERQVVSRKISVKNKLSVGAENIIADSGNLWRGYPDITYNKDDNNYLMVWQEGWHGVSSYTKADNTMTYHRADLNKKSWIESSEINDRKTLSVFRGQNKDIEKTAVLWQELLSGE